MSFVRPMFAVRKHAGLFIHDSRTDEWHQIPSPGETVFWSDGDGVVSRLNGYTVTRISEPFRVSRFRRFVRWLSGSGG